MERESGMESLLNQLKLPEQLKQLNRTQLQQLATEVRDLIIGTVAKNGGHLASNLGVVELTIALLLEFDFHRDKVIFDVGHQAYAWKILTGRLECFRTLRQKNGLAGFPKQSESCYDFFNTGHSSTSISAALGFSRALARSGKGGHAIAVIGDGALTGGMAFEALNDAGQSGENLIVILNDNQMSINRNVGGLSKHLENLRISKKYLRIKSRLDALLLKMPVIGHFLYNGTQMVKRIARLILQRQGVFFEQLGFRYYGPIDGHDLPSLQNHLHAIQDLPGPILLHVLTQKGKGYRFAEESPDLYHGVAPFVVENGVCSAGPAPAAGMPHSFSEAFGQRLEALARHNPRICAISAAMTAGTGLAGFAENYPARFFDVGIAEQHAVTLAGGLAAGGMRPVVALYSTFLQRAYDQVLHDICLQNLPVVLAIDRAGIVGEDGETHQGIYDLGLLLPLPHLSIYNPPDYAALADILTQAVQADHPVAIRYPRGREWPQGLPERPEMTDWRKVQVLRPGRDITIAALGTMAGPALQAAEILAGQGLAAEVLLITCAKPLDLPTLVQSVRHTGRILLVEEALRQGGLGQSALPDLLREIPAAGFDLLGIDDQALPQGKRDLLLAEQQLTPDGIAARAAQLCGDDPKRRHTE